MDRKLMTFSLCLILIMGAVIWSTAPLMATSLWDNEGGDLFGDRNRDQRASQVGDLVTVIIIEEAQATQEAASDGSKSSEVEAGPGLGIFNFFDAFSIGGGDRFDTGGTTTRSGAITAEMTVQIKDVLENGNYSIQGSKSIIVNEEEQEIELTGIIRPDDINLDNTIESTYIADVKIEFHGEGVIGDYQEPGIVTRFLRWLF